MTRRSETRINLLVYKWGLTPFPPLSLLYYLHSLFPNLSICKAQDQRHHHNVFRHNSSTGFLCHLRTRFLSSRHQWKIIALVSVRVMHPEYVLCKLIDHPGLQIRVQIAAGQHRMIQSLILTPTTPVHVASA